MSISDATNRSALKFVRNWSSTSECPTMAAFVNCDSKFSSKIRALVSNMSRPVSLSPVRERCNAVSIRDNARVIVCAAESA